MPVGGRGLTRSCLHCSLARAVKAEWKGDLAGPALRIGCADPLWLPLAGRRVYRDLRQLLRTAHAEAADSLKLAVLDLPGKSHVEVVATLGFGARSRSLSALFPRYESARLAGGFAETIAF